MVCCSAMARSPNDQLLSSRLDHWCNVPVPHSEALEFLCCCTAFSPTLVFCHELQQRSLWHRRATFGIECPVPEPEAVCNRSNPGELCRRQVPVNAGGKCQAMSWVLPSRSERSTCGGSETKGQPGVKLLGSMHLFGRVLSGGHSFVRLSMWK